MNNRLLGCTVDSPSVTVRKWNKETDSRASWFIENSGWEALDHNSISDIGVYTGYTYP